MAVGWVVGLVLLALLVFGAGAAFTDSADLPDSESATATRIRHGSGVGEVAVDVAGRRGGNGGEPA